MHIPTPGLNVLLAPKIKNQNKSWENCGFCSIGALIFFSHPGKCKLTLSASRTKGNWSLEEKRLTFSSISKCLLILRSYLEQPIFSSFSSSSCPLVAFNSVFPPLLTQGETCALLSKRKKKKRRRKRKATLRGWVLFCIKYWIQRCLTSIKKDNLDFLYLMQHLPHLLLPLLINCTCIWSTSASVAFCLQWNRCKW